ncbi:MAG: adenylate kinase family protein [Thaumarchaeota archaeon]|nr:adenylate kinase family protein [Nitrososphaerota archaeon]
MGNIVAITGTPGTGKKTLSPLVARKLGLACVSVNDLAEKYGLVRAEGMVDTEGLRERISKDFRGPALLFGHLIPYVLSRSATRIVVVLRCEPSVLRKRLLSRGYPMSQVRENLEAELIGVVAADARSALGTAKTTEFDTTHLPVAHASALIAEAIVGNGKRVNIDWVKGYKSAPSLRSLLSGLGTEPPLT